MPYQKRYSKKPTSRKSGGYVKSALELTRDISALVIAVRALKAMLNTEKKFQDQSVNGTVAATTNAAPDMELTKLAQGVDDYQRVGKQVKVTSVQGRFQLEQHASATNTLVRVIVAICKSNDGDNMALGDILLAPTNINSFYNLNESHSYSVLYDKLITLDPEHQFKKFKFYQKLSHKVKYIGTAADSASSGSGAIQVWIVSDEATNTPTVASDFRIRYIDN